MSDEHVRYEDLIAHVFGEPSATDSTTIATHLESCAGCRATANRFAAVRATIELDRMPGPSISAIERVKGLMTAAPVVQQAFSPFSTLRRALASLTFDSRQAYALSGLRGSSDSYLLTYAHDDLELDVEIEPPATESESTWHLIGQLASDESLPSTEVTALGGRGHSKTVTTDEHGVFSFALEPGSYDLLIDREQDVVIVPEIDVG
jgi:hypothetical protein